MLPVRRGLAAVVVVAALALTGCSSGNPLRSGSSPSSSAPASNAITIGSAAFAENEIIAEVYAQALEAKGVKVTRKLNIGQRDVYLAALKDGSIDLIPEYTGNLLQFYDKSTTAKSSDDVYAGLNDALPKGLEVLDAAKAEDKDSYNVTQKFSTKHAVTSLADLSKLGGTLKVGGNPELAQRPYGIPGLKSVYNVDASLVPISDNGGPLTVAALKDGTVEMADIFSTTPAIKDEHFVTLDDPKNLIVAQNVVPLITTAKATDTITQVLNSVSAKLTTQDLIEFNTKSSGKAKESASAIAKDWLANTKL